MGAVLAEFDSVIEGPGQVDVQIVDSGRLRFVIVWSKYGYHVLPSADPPARPSGRDLRRQTANSRNCDSPRREPYFLSRDRTWKFVEMKNMKKIVADRRYYSAGLMDPCQ